MYINNNPWIKAFKKPFIISGPCSAETKEQILQTASQMDRSYVEVLRAGIWKPRTKPGGFEGIGKEAFSWLREAKKQTGLRLAIEVATKEHVREALKNEIDILWIGARSTANSFMIEEIGNALEGTDKIVLIKNPMHPNIDSWRGALERLATKGIQNLGLIHRGFSIYEKTIYRNQPFWHLALELKKEYPHIPMLCDISHICGTDKNLFEVANKALDFGYDGLMVETHFDPKNAWSDAQQQILPKLLNNFLKKRSFKLQRPNEILEIKTQIEELNSILFSLIGQNQSLYSNLKETNKESFYLAEIQEKCLDYAQSQGFSKDFIQKWFESFK